MADLVLEGVSPELVARLEVQARSNGRSLEEEVRALLTAAASLSDEAYESALEARRRLAGRVMSDSAELLREDRER